MVFGFANVKELEFYRTISKRHLFFGLAFFLLWSIASSVIIYLKQPIENNYPLLRIVIWQMKIWLPLAVLPFVSRLFIDKIKLRTKNLKKILVIGFGISLIALHFLWFFAISKTSSPYLGLPKTKYGVYPFFFIFWTLLDIIFVTVTLVYLGFTENKTYIKSNKPVLPTKINIKSANKVHSIEVSDILWIGADEGYIRIYTKDRFFIERASLRSISTKLSDEIFIRIHRSTIINLNAVVNFVSLSKQKGKVTLIDGNERIVSRTYLKILKQKLSESCI